MDGRFSWPLGRQLVVETTNFRVGDRGRFGVQYDGMTDKNLHITERFTGTSPDSILYRAPIDDSTVYQAVDDGSVAREIRGSAF
jgi:hypothetical protein